MQVPPFLQGLLSQSLMSAEGGAQNLGERGTSEATASTRLGVPSSSREEPPNTAMLNSIRTVPEPDRQLGKQAPPKGNLSIQ